MRTSSFPRTSAMIAMGILVLAPGCSSDDGDDTATDAPSTTQAPDTTEAPGSTAASVAAAGTLCSTWVEIDAISSALGGPETPPEEVAAVASEMGDLLDAVTEPPDELQSQLETTRGAIATAAAGDPSAFGSEDLTAAAATIGAWVHDECGFEQVEIAYTEYAFGGVGSELASGPTSFRATATGDEAHVLVLGRLVDDSIDDPEQAVVDAISAGPDGEAALAAVVEPVVSGAFAAPGQTASVTADLAPGTYVLYCPIPTGFTGEGPPPMDAPAHATNGMVAAVSVT